MTALHSKAISLDEDGRLRINRAAPKIKHAKIVVTTTEIKLETGLANRRTLIIKPVRSGTDPDRDRRWIEIGPSGFSSDEGTPIWEEYELILQVGPQDEIYAKKGDDIAGNIDIRIIEIGEG